MTGLAQQQAQMLQALFGAWRDDALHDLVQEPPAFRQRALRAYRSHGRVLAARVLAAACPVTCALLGQETLDTVAAALWQTHPPQCGDLARWGAELPDFLAASNLAQTEPYLADVAALEWQLHALAALADASQDTTTLALLMTEDPAHVGVLLAPGTAVISSAWPVGAIVSGHSGGEAGLARATQRLQAGVGETVLVWRDGFQPRWRLCLPGEPAFVRALLAGDALTDALAQSPDLDFNHWLSCAVQEQLWISNQLRANSP